MVESLRTRERVELSTPVSKWAEKLTPRAIGELPFQMTLDVVKKVIPVPEDRIADMVAGFLIHSNLLVEGSGAVGAAALLSDQESFRGKRTAVLITGRNVPLELVTAALVNRQK